MPDLDHREMTPPSLRVVERKLTPGGDAVVVWDLRLVQPNVGHVSMRVIHSLEHSLAVHMKKQSDAIVNIGCMGCQTGMYIIAIGISDFGEMAPLLEQALTTTLEQEAVPLANTVACGWALNHSLEGVKSVAETLLRRKSEWAQAVLWT